MFDGNVMEVKFSDVGVGRVESCPPLVSFSSMNQMIFIHDVITNDSNLWRMETGNRSRQGLIVQSNEE